MLGLSDVLAGLGFLMLAVGLFLWWPAGALMICGGLLLAIGLGSAMWRAR